jgi:hypothetical protein
MTHYPRFAPAKEATGAGVEFRGESLSVMPRRHLSVFLCILLGLAVRDNVLIFVKRCQEHAVG